MTLTLEKKLWIHAAAPGSGPRSSKPDPALEAVLAKADDRLLADAGLTRRDVMSEDAYLWRLWIRGRREWSL